MNGTLKGYVQELKGRKGDKWLDGMNKFKGNSVRSIVLIWIALQYAKDIERALNDYKEKHGLQYCYTGDLWPPRTVNSVEIRYSLEHIENIILSDFQELDTELDVNDSEVQRVIQYAIVGLRFAMEWYGSSP